MRSLERMGKLDRYIEFLPDDESIKIRLAQRQGLTRPELAVLLAYAKRSLYPKVLASAIPDDPALDSVLPVVEAGLTQMVDGAAQLDENLKVEPAPGHTPGTIAIKFESKGEKGLFCGDILHHALQVYHPEWNSFACAEAIGARKSRREALEHCAGSGARLMPCHFGAPFTCHIDHKGSGFVPRFDAHH